MSDRTIVRALRAIVATGTALAVAGSVALIVSGHVGFWWDWGGSFAAPLAFFFAVFVWRVIANQPRNAVVWAMASTSFFFGLYAVGGAVAAALVSGDPGILFDPSITPADLPPEVAWVLVFSAMAWVPGLFSLTTLGLLLFPDGRLPSPRWRWLAMFAIVTLLVGTVLGASGYRPESTYQIGADIADDVLASVLISILMLISLLSLLGLISRFRRSRGLIRQQFKWVVWGASVFVFAVALAFPLEGTSFEGLSSALFYVAAGFLMTSYAIAIGKYRLYDVDVVISRTVVLGVLAGFITLTYALVVVGLGQLVGEGSDGLLLPIAATAVIAVAFEPVRNIAQAWANRLVYGKRATPYEVLSDLTRRLGRAEEGEGILIRLAVLLRDGTGAERATVWLGVPGAMEPASTSPADADVELMPDLDDPSTFTVFHDGEVIGALEVVKPRGTVLSTAEKSLVADLAGSAGAVLGYQLLNDSLEQRARELEESRARLMGVQDQERRRLERDLHEGAEQFIVALKVKIGVASQLAGKHEAPDLAELLHGLTEEAQAALDDVQSLAKGIYPPILESDGLGAAISALASSSPVEVWFERDGLGRYPMEIEAAVYFDVSEAVTNAVKHAEPPIRIVLSHHDGTLTFSVVDAGPGFEIDKSEMGSGLENMADRLDAIGGALRVKSARGESTEVSGTIPVESLALI